MLLDSLVYKSGLKDVHPGEKLIFALITMCIGFIPSVYSGGLIILLMAGTITIKGKIPPKTYLHLIFLPLAFLGMSILPIVINFGASAEQSLIYFPFFQTAIGITYSGLKQAGFLFVRSMALVSCLYFISLTTPILDIIALLKKLNVPGVLLDLMLLIYRQLFIVLDTAESIYTAQNARLGYANFKASLNSLGKLVSYLITKSFSDAGRLYTALVSRGYDGELKVLDSNYRFSVKNLLLIAAIDTALLVIALKTGGPFK